MEYQRYRVAGHKLKHSRSGAQDAYARGDCECGWTFTGWTHWKRDVVSSHNSHLKHVLGKMGWQTYTVNRAWTVFAKSPEAAAVFRANQRRLPWQQPLGKPERIDSCTWLIGYRKYVVTIERET